MTYFLKKILFLLVFCCMATQVYAQRDTLSTDSAITRIESIIMDYTKRVVFIDTSDYEQFYSDRDDINLQIASSRGYCGEILRLVLKGADVDNNVGNNARPIHYAVTEGKMNAAELLLLLNASPDSYDSYGNTPSIVAVKGRNLEMTELIIRYGADLSLSDRNGETPLHHSIALGEFYISDMLLYYGAPLEAVDAEGNTPLMVAVWTGQYDVTDMLLREGADPNAADRKGYTPLMMASQNGDTLMLRMLINAGANLYSVNSEGFDALTLAVRKNHADVVNFLFENGNRWSSVNEKRINPVAVALSYGYRDLVPLLKEKGITMPRRPLFDEFSVTAGGLSSNHYAMFTGSITLKEPMNGIGITAGVDFNPVKWRLLVDGNDGIIYQYRLKSTVLHAGFLKELTINDNLAGGALYGTISLSAGYRIYSYYSGTLQKPGNSFCLIPSAGLNWNKKHFGINADIIYMKTPFFKVFPVWFKMGGSFILYKDRSRTAGKKIRIYNYDQ